MRVYSGYVNTETILYFFTLPHFSQILIPVYKSSPHYYISCVTSVTNINSKMNKPSNYREMGFFSSLHIQKNPPRITVFRTLKYPDPSMILLPADVRMFSKVNSIDKPHTDLANLSVVLVSHLSCEHRDLLFI